MKCRALQIAFFISLALNVAFIGYQGARLFHHAPSHDEVINSRENSFASLLPKAAQQEIHEELASKRHELRSHMNRTKHLRQVIRELIENEPVDTAALDSAFSEMRHEHDVTQKIYHDAFIKATAKLDVKTRKHVTQNLQGRHDEDDK